MTQAQRILWILDDGQPHSHHEFYGFCVLHSRISELRKKGHNIKCWREGDSYLYQLKGVPQASAKDGGDARPTPMGLPESESTLGGTSTLPPLGAAEAPPVLTSSPGDARPAVLRQPTLWEAA